MKFTGVVKDGVVVLIEGPRLKDGTPVEVEVTDSDENRPTLAEIFKNVAGKAVGLPSDMARNHDHYLYGLPKRTNE